MNTLHSLRSLGNGLILPWRILPALSLGLLFFCPTLAAETLVTSDSLRLQAFDTETLEFTSFGDGSELFIEALAVSPDGQLYGASFEGLFLIHPRSGRVNSVGPLVPAISLPTAMGFHPDGRLFISDFSQLYRVDPATGEVTQLATPGVSIRGFATDGTQLLAAGLDGQSWALYEVDPDSGVLSQLHGLGLPAPGGIIAASQSSMCPDSSGAGLWVFTITGSLFGTELTVDSVDLATGVSTDIVDFPTDQGPFPSACAVIPAAASVVDVPSLEDLGFAVLAGLLGLAGLLTLGRIRSA